MSKKIVAAQEPQSSDRDDQRAALKSTILKTEVAIREHQFLSMSEAVNPGRLTALKVELQQAKQSLAVLDLKRAGFDRDASK